MRFKRPPWAIDLLFSIHVPSPFFYNNRFMWSCRADLNALHCSNKNWMSIVLLKLSFHRFCIAIVFFIRRGIFRCFRDIFWVTTKKKLFNWIKFSMSCKILHPSQSACMTEQHLMQHNFKHHPSYFVKMFDPNC